MTEKCSACEQMKKENVATRKAIADTNRNYVQVCNENLALRRALVRNGIYFYGDLDSNES